MKADPKARRQALRALLGGLAGSAGLLGAVQARADSPAAAKVWRLAVVPQLTPVEMARHWTPVVQHLAQAGFPCELVVPASIASFEPEFLEARADVVFLNPYHMVMAHRAHHYEPLLRDSRALEGVLVVRKDSPIRAITQLRDQRLSFPAPNAFAASLYIRAMLERQHQLRYEPHYALNHRNAIRQVLAGDSAAAGVVRTTLEMEPAEVQQQLHVLYTTPRLSPHPLAVHPRVPAALRRTLSDTLLTLAEAPEGRALMAGIQLPAPQKTSYSSDYAGLERLRIEKFVVRE